MSTPRRPARLAVYSESGTFYPRELTELDGKLYFTNDSGSDTVIADSNATITIKNSAGQVLDTVKPATGGEITLDIPTTETYTATIGTTWSGSAAPYTQTISVPGMLSTDNPIVDIVLNNSYDSSQAALEQYGKIYRITTANNSITVYANEKTESSISIQLKCIR